MCRAMRLPLLLAAAAPMLLANADPASIPPQIKTMLDAAIASGNESEVATIVKYASTAAPDSREAIAKLANDWKKKRSDEKTAKLQDAGFLDLWSGRAELGGFISTGNSESEGVSASLALTRDGLDWRQKLKFQADYQRSLGVTSREHYLASWEPNWKIDNRSYIYGSALFESDRFLGYNQRYSVSTGAGYSALKTDKVKLDLELGPAYRATSFTDGGDERSIAARGSVDFSWKLGRGLQLTQNAAAYVERYNSTVTGTTALSAKVLGPLSAQFSYNIQYESMPPEGRVTTDTTSRAGLVYAF
jgi:putative salt-induced outer membrane protein